MNRRKLTQFVFCQAAVPIVVAVALNAIKAGYATLCNTDEMYKENLSFKQENSILLTIPHSLYMDQMLSF